MAGINWAAVVQHMQVITGLTWFGFVLNNMGSMIRCLTRRRLGFDAVLAGLVVLAVSECARIGYWVSNREYVGQQPDADLQIRAAIQLASALSTIVILWGVNVETNEGRHKTALALQIGIFILAVLGASVQ